MFLRKLKLVNFRNYSEFEEKFDHLKILILGQNAQGKSNILEAINILATSESDKAERDSDLVSWNNEFGIIFADIETKDSTLEIAIQLNSSGRRKLKINGVAKKAPQADLLGNFFAVMFSCEDLYLIKGSPSMRRKWLDSTLYQLDKSYHKALNEYQKTITQKNALFKRAYENGIPTQRLKEQLEIWNEQIVNLGTEILTARISFINEISPIAEEFLSNISKQTETLSISYKSTISESTDFKSSCSENHIKEIFKSMLESSFENERRRGQSLIGPHRDDLIFLINEKEARSFGSQGQQRSIILALKLAELKVIESRKNEIPVLLLDDVFAELDEKRQDFLLHNLPENIQIFLTTTHLSNIQKEFLKGAGIFEVEKGAVLKKAAC